MVTIIQILSQDKHVKIKGVNETSKTRTLCENELHCRL